MPTVLVITRDPRVERLWLTARWTALLLVPALLVLLLLAPHPTLKVLWSGIIPILPATFFLSPALWRGICPLATLNEWGNRLGPARRLPLKGAAALSVSGLLLFHLMVPARRLLFNQDGLALVLTVAGVGLLALAAGALFSVRSAFCNGLCPVLPVEQIYGQAPLLDLQRGRCTACTTCSPKGCLDLAAGKVIPQTLGPARRSAAWLGTPFGIFAAALPGFILGYNQLADGPLTSAPAVYATTLGWSLASYAAIGALVLALRIPSAVAMTVIAALAGATYYWYAGPSTARAFELPAPVSAIIQLVGIGLVGVWLLRRLRAWAPAG
jgi:hypothetical protein